MRYSPDGNGWTSHGPWQPWLERAAGRARPSAMMAFVGTLAGKSVGRTRRCTVQCKLKPEKFQRRVPVGTHTVIGRWKCVKNCGACCYLNPAEREPLDEYLSKEDFDLYMSMVGEDGWCINYDKEQRLCNIYEDRPSFCRPSMQTMGTMLGVETDDDFELDLIDTCLDHIVGVYGENSLEFNRYTAAVDVPDEEDEAEWVEVTGEEWGPEEESVE